MSGKRLVISINSSWNFVNFRAGLIRSLVAEGYEIIAAAPYDEYTPKLAALGCRFEPLPLSGRGTSPIGDGALFLSYLQLLRRERPTAYMGFTVKPNVYGSLAAHSLGIPVLNNIAGLGAAFAERGWLNWLVRQLYRRALVRSAVVFFQNPEDRDQFVQDGLVRAEISRLLPGSGVDISHFSPRPRPLRSGEETVFLMIARMLWTKGVYEYVSAARTVRRRFPNVRFQILGIIDEAAKGAVSRKDIEGWVEEGVIEFLGAEDDVRPYIESADCVVLPTFYREGTPRSLLEGAAMGRPLIATNVPGCREVVKDGINGFQVTPRDAEALANAMIKLAELPSEQRTSLAGASRRIAENQFDERLVIDHYLAALSGAEQRER
ncbi:glycosyltransferase family 4 protein [Allosphingosinicella humi]